MVYLQTTKVSNGLFTPSHMRAIGMLRVCAPHFATLPVPALGMGSNTVGTSDYRIYNKGKKS
jgi:hypothetical protein